MQATLQALESGRAQSPGSVSIVTASSRHLAAVTSIYLDALAEGLATYEDPVPDLAEMGRRLATVRDAGLPWIVAVDEAGRVLGFAYARPFRDRAGWRHVVEDSVYVARNAQGRGIGRRLVEALIELCTARGYRQMIAVVSDARNAASIRLHEALGFLPCGFLPGAAWRADGPADAVLLQRPLTDPTLIGHA